MNISEFLQQVKSKGRHHDLAAFVKNQDQVLVNKLAKNLQLVFEGMNIDGVKTYAHEHTQAPVPDTYEETSPCRSEHSPEKFELGDQSQLLLKKRISMASIELERQ